jgi:hypothetical protein
MTSTDRRRLLLTLQQERLKGLEAWEDLCGIAQPERPVEPAADPSRPQSNPIVQRIFRLRRPRPDDIGAHT